MSDTTSLNYLARLHQQELLPQLFGTVIIPPAVAAELAVGASAYAEINAVLHASWLEVRTLTDAARADQLATEIDRGEAEAVTLALELKADVLLMDDLPGRRCAEHLNLRVLGTLGLLSLAKAKGLVPALKPLVERLVRDMRFRASERIIQQLLRSAGE